MFLRKNTVTLGNAIKQWTYSHHNSAQSIWWQMVVRRNLQPPQSHGFYFIGYLTV